MRGALHESGGSGCDHSKSICSHLHKFFRVGDMLKVLLDTVRASKLKHRHQPIEAECLTREVKVGL